MEIHFVSLFIAVIEVAVGEYNVDMSKMMAAAVKKFNEERDTYYLGTFSRDNYIRADTGALSICMSINQGWLDLIAAILFTINIYTFFSSV